MPKGGFGNLIALPLQKAARARDCSVFVDEQLHPHPDQWAFLAAHPRMSAADLEPTILQATGGVHPLDVTFVEEEDLHEPSKGPDTKSSKIAGPMPSVLTITLSNLVYLEKEHLSQALANRLIRLAAFQNPEFYKAQAMRMPVWDKPRVIGGGKSRPTGRIDIAVMQCGPIRHVVTRAQGMPNDLQILPRIRARPIAVAAEAGIQEVF